jgi:hypothetical protein
MGQRQTNYRRIKIHRTYTVEELARLFAVHKNTVRIWIKAGLPTIDEKRPTMMLGAEASAFLQARRARNKRTCKPGQIYCLRCRAPKCPAGDMAEYIPINENVGNLRAICPDCDSFMHRCASKSKLGQVLGKLDVTFPQALRHLSESNQPSVNSDLR